VLELSAVLGGRVSSSTRFSKASMRANSTRTSASFSASVSLLRSTSGITKTMNQAARHRVNDFPTSGMQRPVVTPSTQVSSYDKLVLVKDRASTLPRAW